MLLGIGHTNALFLRRWRSAPVPDAKLTCLSDQHFATYSGMLPAVLSGHVPEGAMRLDLPKLCRESDARLVQERVIGLEPTERKLLFENRPAIHFDVLSIGIGSTSRVDSDSVTDGKLVGIKPMQTFLGRLTDSLHRAINGIGNRPLRILVVGGGVAGLEIAFCLPSFLRSHSGVSYSLKVISPGALAPDVSLGLSRRLHRELARRDVKWVKGSVSRVTEQGAELRGGDSVPADLVIWAAGAAPAPLLSQLGLPLNETGFLATSSSLLTTSGHPIFAVGDCGTQVDRPHPKAGVYAVRQAPILWENVRRLLANRPLRPFQPQSSFLKLVNLGDGRAAGEWRGVAFQGRWAMRLKHWIDQRFMNQFQE